MPRASSRTRAADFVSRLLRNAGGHAHADQPAPVAASGRAADCAWLQPKRSAPMRRHSTSSRCEKRPLRLLGIDLRVVAGCGTRPGPCRASRPSRPSRSRAPSCPAPRPARAWRCPRAGRARPAAWRSAGSRPHRAASSARPPSRACRRAGCRTRLSCAIAVILPSRVGADADALDRRRPVRGVVGDQRPGQRDLHRAGPPPRAPSAASTASARMNSLRAEAAADVGRDRRGPSPAGCRASRRCRALPQAIIWLEVQSVSLSPSHAAMVACGSIIAWLSSGVV